MSIQTNIKELESIKMEIKRNLESNKKLRNRTVILEDEIKGYLQSKNQEGVKYKDQSFVLEHTTSHTRRKKADKEEDTKRMLRNMGVHDIDNSYTKLMAVQKGEEIETTKLRVKKHKKT